MIIQSTFSPNTFEHLLQAQYLLGPEGITVMKYSLCLLGVFHDKKILHEKRTNNNLLWLQKTGALERKVKQEVKRSLAQFDHL